MHDFFRYHGVWAPGVRLFRHLKFRTKAALISLVLLIPAFVFGFAFLSDTQDQIHFTVKEREGIAAMRQMVPLLHAVLETRNATRATLGGHDVSTDYLAARKRADAALDAFEAQLRSNADPLGLTLKVAALRKAWVATASSKNGADDKGRTVFGPVSEAAIAVLQGISDDSNLVLDPDIDTLYTILATFITLPKAAEDLGQVWGWGTYGVAHGGLDNPEQYGRYSVWMARATGGIDDALLAFQRAFAANAHLKERIDLSGLKAAKTFAATAAVADRIKAADDPAEFYAAGRKALAQYFKIFDGVLPALDDLLNQREQRLTLQRNLRITVVAIALLIGAYLFACFAKVMDGGLEEVARHLDAMADGDLTRTPRPWGNDEAAHLLHSLGRTQLAMRKLVQDVRDVSATIVVASSQIAQGAGDLSARTERAAAGLQETASSLNEIATSLEGTTAGTERTTHVAGNNAVAADAGGQVIAEAVQTMSQLRDVSTRIRDIIGTIDGIAFQTNILALNAAVEAARAGEQGRGFAVVAGEVRSLAQRSAQAAREIKSLITDSVERMQAGTSVVEQAGLKVQEMRSGAQVISQLIGEIASSAQRQNAGVQAIGKTVFDLDRMTQENAALVEETAAASEALHQRAQELEGAVSRFKVPAAGSLGASLSG